MNGLSEPATQYRSLEETTRRLGNPVRRSGRSKPSEGLNVHHLEGAGGLDKSAMLHD